MNQYKVGDGATISSGSDSYPYTIIWISPDGKKMTLQEDSVKRTDNNGMSEAQEYDYFRNKDGTIVDISLRKNGQYKVVGSKHQLVSLGVRRRYYDFSF